MIKTMMMDRNNAENLIKTKLGWLPGSWRVVSLEKMAKFYSGGTPRKDNSDYWGGTTPWFSAKDLKSFSLRNTTESLTKKGVQNGTKLVEKDTILILVRGMMLNRDLPVGITTRSSAFNQDIKALSVKEGINTYFLAYSILNKKKKILGLVDRSSHGTGKLETSILKSLLFPLPPEVEQQKIATILSTWDRAIATTQQLIAAKEEQLKGVMQRLLTPTEEWQEYTYGEVLNTVKRNLEWDDDALYDLISVRRRSGGLFHRESLYGHQIKTKNLRTAREGDFLISKMQIVHGASALTTTAFDGMKISGSYIAVVSKDIAALDIEFLNWYSKTPYFYHQTYISSYGVHIEKMTFNYKSFLKLPIILPSVKRQREIKSILDTAQKELRLLEKKLEVLKQQKKGLMQQLLTGKTRVK